MEAENSEKGDPSPDPATEPVSDDSSSSSNDKPLADLVDSMAADLITRLEYGIGNNKIDEVRTLLSSRDDLLEALIDYEFDEDDGKGDRSRIIKLTPLAFAAALDRASIIELLLERNADVNAEILVIGGTALHMSARYGTKASVDLLLARTTNINLRDGRGSSPLHLASRYNKREIVACLLDAKADFDLRRDDGCTPFHEAAAYGNVEILKLLYERGSKKYINEGDVNANTPLILATSNGMYDATKWLLSVGAAIEQAGSQQTPLTNACAKGNVGIVSLLLDNGANIHKTNTVSQTPILAACSYTKLEVVKELIRRGALASDVGQTGWTCFHNVIWSEEKSSSVIKEIFRLLLSAGADINRSNKAGDTPLGFACLKQKIWHVECLLDSGANINQKNPLSGDTALMVACRKPDDQVVKTLLQRNADMTTTNKEGLTALGIATIYELKNVKALIQGGANVIALDRRGYTALRYALQGMNREIGFELLVAEQYHSRNTTLKDRSIDLVHDTAAVGSKLLEHLANGEFKGLDRLHAIMFWAVSNDALELTRKCVEIDQEVLEWCREGSTWLHIASGNGSVQAVEFLLDTIAKTPDQVASWVAAGAIIKQNSRGDSPLTLSLNRPQDEIQNLFWKKIRQLRDTDTAFIDMYSVAADRILELLARYEKAGYEDILKEFLQRWYSEEAKGLELNTALHWAVQRRKVIVVWWLLSKGGYSSDAIQSAQKLVPGPYGENDACSHIRDLLLRPPPILDHTPNPNKEHAPAFQVGIEKSADPALMSSLGNIVDIMVSDGKSIRIRYAEPTIHDIIYGVGIESVMKKAKDDLGQRDLNALRGSLMQIAPKKGENVSQDDNDDTEERSNDNPGDLRARWIHLPVNELHLMRDLVSRLSYDLKRSERDHMALMKHFNRSWSEIAAGGGRYYMKPQCVQQPKQPQHEDHSNHSLSEGGISKGQCVAIYMPYLTIGDCPDSPSLPATKLLDESGTSRDSRRVRHIPLTLDQYYYPTLLDTFARDNDQVLSKFLEKHGQSLEPRATRKILMVNNLWIWILDEKTIITATADDSDQESTGSLLKVIWSEARNVFGEATSVYSIMELFLSAATGFFVAKSADIYNKGPIEIFRDSMRDVADQETRLFREFLNGLQEADKAQGVLPNQDLDNEPQGQRRGSSRYHVISSETVLLEALRDIRDELQMLSSIADDQEAVWKKAFSSYNKGKKSRSFQFYTPADAKKDIDVMLLEATNTENYVRYPPAGSKDTSWLIHDTDQ
ncbi:hypothetical protein O1611_g5834 [Lasiodiplodia mahajangana]|uniref:Uncharacterized protein n=1 Tax=Lasiodiplodia mahajangana TaxID=1108764 RepID=A0ACC2JK43_9PEZI|nr:hypothetical protein O1611_g5834 [Lasiodiplodia mahajangana]